MYEMIAWLHEYTCLLFARKWIYNHEGMLMAPSPTPFIGRHHHGPSNPLRRPLRNCAGNPWSSYVTVVHVCNDLF